MKPRTATHCTPMASPFARLHLILGAQTWRIHPEGTPLGSDRLFVRALVGRQVGWSRGRGCKDVESPVSWSSGAGWRVHRLSTGGVPSTSLKPVGGRVYLKLKRPPHPTPGGAARFPRSRQFGYLRYKLKYPCKSPA